jgi:hypothetical protein
MTRASRALVDGILYRGAIFTKKMFFFGFNKLFTFSNAFWNEKF